jgi:acyl carrier protein
MEELTHSILKRLQTVFNSVFAVGINVRADLTAHDVTGWDSLTHVKLILAVEREFHIRFSLREINSFQNVGDMANAIESKAKKNTSVTDEF